MAQAQRKQKPAAAKRQTAKTTIKATARKQQPKNMPEWMPRGHDKAPDWPLSVNRGGMFRRPNLNAFEGDQRERMAARLVVSDRLTSAGRHTSGAKVDRRVPGSLDLLGEAQMAMADGHPDQSRRHHEAVRRIEILDYTEEQRRAKTIELQYEADKISSGWRREAIKTLLSKPEGSKRVAPSADAILKAVELRDEHFDNVWMRWRLRRRNLFYLFAFLPVAIAVVFELSSQGVLGPAFNDPALLMAVCLFGALGASISSVFSHSRLNQSAKIAERVNSSLLVLLRPVVGAASALAAYVLLIASVGFGWLEGQSIVPALIYMVAITAGFSEAFLVRLSPKSDE